MNTDIAGAGGVNRDKSILDMQPQDYASLKETASLFENRYDCIEFLSAGTSVFGRDIPMIKLSDGNTAERGVIFVGTLAANDRISAPVLLRFVNELCEFWRDDRRAFSINIRSMLRSRSVYVIPALNVDGMELFCHGVPDDCPIAERIRSMSGGSFDGWEANARGVDLKLNFSSDAKQSTGYAASRGYGGENPLSEPECSALDGFLRFNEDIRLAITVESKHSEIRYAADDSRSHVAARLLERMSGNRLAETGEGLTAYAAKNLGRLAYTVGCGSRHGVTHGDLFPAYESLRELLFTAPILV